MLKVQRRQRLFTQISILPLSLHWGEATTTPQTATPSPPPPPSVSRCLDLTRLWTWASLPAAAAAPTSAPCFPAPLRSLQSPPSLWWLWIKEGTIWIVCCSTCCRDLTPVNNTCAAIHFISIFFLLLFFNILNYFIWTFKFRTETFIFFKVTAGIFLPKYL